MAAVAAEQSHDRSEDVTTEPIPIVIHEDVQRQIIEQLPLAEAERDPELSFVDRVPVESVQDLGTAPDGQETAVVVAPLATEGMTAVEADEAEQQDSDTLDNQLELAVVTETGPDEDAPLTDVTSELYMAGEEDLSDSPAIETDVMFAATELEPTDTTELEYEAPQEESASIDLAAEMPTVVWDPESDEPTEVPAVIAEPIVQLNEAVPQFDTETAREVHKVIKEAESIIEEAIQKIEAAPEAEVDEETIEQLVETIQQLYAVAGINLGPDEVKHLVHELLNQADSAEVSEETLEDDRFVERGTLEKLQWFQSYLKNLKWQTNPVHLFLGKFALTSVRELQAA